MRRMRPVAFLLLSLVMFVACNQASEQAAEEEPVPGEAEPGPELAGVAGAEAPAANAPTTAAGEATALPTFEGHPLIVAQSELFAASGSCAVCHTNMTDASGANVSFDRTWRATMMANAARDPYWQASVRAETIENPDLQPVIEDKCATCHMPMARFQANVNGEDVAVLDEGFLDPEHPLHELAMDGVSCTLCHQIAGDNLGAPESFSGHYDVSLDAPVDERPAFGPFEVQPELSVVMSAASNFAPLQSEHIQQSEACATCHALYTPFVDANGEVAGEFPEQTPYLEWDNSSYAGAQSCQDCHMPQASGGVQLSVTGGPLREPVRQHTFAGGSNTMLTVLRAQGAEMNVTASSENFSSALDRMTAQLTRRTAMLSLGGATVEDGTLSVQAHIASNVGHKFPSGFPSRRVWLHLTVTDAGGNVVFESGAVDVQGMIEGNDNDADPAQFEPHYDTISQPDEVQIYETIMGTTDGDVTTTLLRAAEYLKDNRILPDGFDKAGAREDIAVYGAAADDDSFEGGEDRILYAVDVGGGAGPLTVTAELLYQSIAYRWAENLREYDAAEVDQFFALMEDVPNPPVTVATDSLTVRP